MNDRETLPPAEIERRSMQIIERELGARAAQFDPLSLLVLKRVLHTTADFDYVENLRFSPDAAAQGMRALLAGATVVTDTNMARMGVNAAALQKLGCTVRCFMADPDVAQQAKARGVTRAAVSMEQAALLCGPLVVAVGNAPTALLRLAQLIEEGQMAAPALTIAAPVGFVQVLESKARIAALQTPSIVAAGRKGGSPVAAAVCNALLYEALRQKGLRRD